MVQPDIISNQVARRFILGLSGLWPARRWSSKKGAARAIHQIGSVQMDAMTVVERSHHLVLWSRVDGYQTHYLDELLYQHREFFDYGGNLRIYPMDELPYWRVHMARRSQDKRPAAFFFGHAAAVDEARAAVRNGGPLAGRDLSGESVSSYRARNTGALSLYNLWLTGELMTHHRNGFERVYDLRERVAPPALDFETSESEAEEFFALKAMRMLGVHTARAWRGQLAFLLNRTVDVAEARAWLDGLVGGGHVTSVGIEEQREPYYFLASERPKLEVLVGGDVPEEWRAGSEEDEAIFLSPLDNVLARKRTRDLFDFEYLWEAYKPAEQRRWGYYTMPILWQDRLVGRFDPKLDRKSGKLIIHDIWFEDEHIAQDEAFRCALDRGLKRFARFHSSADIERGEA
ncbi:MAG: winged helix-turn-helix domain-containing protein [Chloroflexota bacterium]